VMDLSLRDALGGGGGGVPGGAPAEALLKRDFMSTLEKEHYDDKVGETVAKSDYRPLLDGKDPKCGEHKHCTQFIASNKQAAGAGDSGSELASGLCSDM
uniref:Uncharacterized protein n=1 Tax=Periophthalmus magnuspinnatus TaxID=409849 RepID=A0A3B4AZU1_9GOBI